MRKLDLDAVQWYFGCTKTEAKMMIAEMPASTIENIIVCFQGNAKRAFLND